MLCWRDAAGQGGKKISIAGNPVQNKDIIFVSDVHYHLDEMPLIQAMAEYVHEQYGIKDVAIERSRSFAYLVDRYVQDGDSAIFYYKMLPSNVQALESWRAMNAKLPRQEQLTVHGVDFERMEFIVALRSIFRQHPGMRGTGLFRYIDSLPDSVCRVNALGKERRRFRVAVYGKARAIFRSEEAQLSGILGKDHEIVRSILENPVTEKRFGHRDQDMPKSILEQLSDKRFICFLGHDHIEPARYFSTLRKFVRNTGKRDITIVTEVCKHFNKAPRNAPPDLITVGPGYIHTNDKIMELGFTKYQKNGHYTLVDQNEFKGELGRHYHSIPTYYVFSDLLDE